MVFSHPIGNTLQIPFAKVPNEVHIGQWTLNLVHNSSICPHHGLILQSGQDLAHG